MNFRLLGSAVLALALAGTAAAAVRLSANVQTGASISATQNFRVTAQSDDLVTSVEFYVNDSLRATDESTPYEFSIDTLVESDGPLTVRFDAYTEKGDKGTLSLRLTIDNGISKGIQFHLEKGEDALVNRKWDEAILAGRVALKIDDNSTAARAILARANYGKGVMDLAQKYLEDVLAVEPNNSSALQLLAGIQIDRAFETFTIGGAARMEAISQIGSALERASKSRQTTLIAPVDALGPAPATFDASRIRTLLLAGRYTQAINELTPLMADGRAAAEAQNALVYALIRSSRLREALAASDRHLRFGQPDAYSYVLRAMLLQLGGKEKESRDAEKEAILSDPTGTAVKVGQVFLALRRGEVRAFSQLAQELARTEDQSFITDCFLSTLFLAANQFTESSDAIKRALKTEPAAYDVYVERANQVILYTVNTPGLGGDELNAQRALARAFFNAALAAKPESAQALTGISLLLGMQGQNAEALQFARAAVAAGPEYAAGQFALASALSANGQGQEARAVVLKAGEIDPANLRSRTAVPYETAWRYFMVYGRIPLLPLQ